MQLRRIHGLVPRTFGLSQFDQLASVASYEGTVLALEEFERYLNGIDRLGPGAPVASEGSGDVA